MGPRNIYEFKTLTGEIEVERRRKAAKFCDSLGQFSKSYEKINKFIGKRCKDLQARAHMLADDYYAIGAEINHFSELLKTTEIPQIVSMYRRLSDLVIRNGDFTLQSGELMNQQLAAWFKYQRQESRSFQEAHWLRDESVARYNAQKVDLNKRKEKLYRRKDVSEWGVPSDKLREALDNINDAERSFELMLPNVSQDYMFDLSYSGDSLSQLFGGRIGVLHSPSL